jgi:hypothetical protein
MRKYLVEYSPAANHIFHGVLLLCHCVLSFFSSIILTTLGSPVAVLSLFHYEGHKNFQKQILAEKK